MFGLISIVLLVANFEMGMKQVVLTGNIGVKYYLSMFYYVEIKQQKYSNLNNAREMIPECSGQVNDSIDNTEVWNQLIVVLESKVSYY